MRTRYAALAATFMLAAAVAATILLTSSSAPQPTAATPRPRHPRPATRPPLRHANAAGPRCTTPTTDPTCIRAVYKGAPDDYAQVQDIPDSVLIQPDDDGRYQVERGQQITVVTAAPLPTGYTRFYLQSQPLQVTVSPTSHEPADPAGRDDLHLHGHERRGWVQPDQLRPDGRKARGPIHEAWPNRNSATSW